jgi:putative transposase
MIYPLVRELAVDGVPVAVTCRVLGFSRQAFYAWDADPVSDRDWDDAHLVNAIRDVHGDDPEFGYRFIADELAANPSVVDASENRVWRLCRQNGITSVITKRGGPGKTPGPAVHDDHVQRQFTAAAPNLLWLVDITEHRTAEGKLYACMVKDCYSNRIVGYSLDSRMKASLAVAALSMAIQRRKPQAGLVVHSDRGQPISLQGVHPAAARPPPGRVDGSGVLSRGQRRDGELLLPAAGQRAQPATLGHPRPAAPGHRVLDRAHLPPPAPPAGPRQAHPCRV